jgi:hypothetical protein
MLERFRAARDSRAELAARAEQPTAVDLLPLVLGPHLYNL